MQTQKVLEALQRRGYRASFFESGAQCVAYLCREIRDTQVGMGGSATLTQLGIYPLLAEHNRVLWHNDPQQVQELGAKNIRDMAMNTPVYLSSVNALTEDGVAVSIDYTGNRLASLCYGHERVYIVVGMNKIVPDLEQALHRARHMAAPKNARRLQRNTPCAKQDGACCHGESDQCLCHGLLILEKAMAGGKTEVLLVNEELGF